MKTIENSDMENKKNLSFKFKFPALFLEIIGDFYLLDLDPEGLYIIRTRADPDPHD